MNAHTAGPWHVTTGGQQVRSETDQIARVWMMRRGEGVANARLIAAAPDLLAALQGILSGAGRHTIEFDAARAAIDKAIGESK